MSEKKNPQNAKKDIRIPALIVACGVLALALIVVSAFAYQWNTEKKELKQKYQTAQALIDYDEIMTNNDELGNLSMQVASLTSQNEAQAKTIEEYEALLIENGLMEAEEEDAE